MADVQLQNGYTRIANKIMEALAKTPLNGTQFRILVVVLRFTYGFNRKEAELSESYLSKATGIHKQQIKRELKVLINCHIVKIIQEATFNTPRIIAFNKDAEQWINSLQVTKKIPDNESDTATGSENDTSTGSGLDTQERKELNKDIKTTPIAPKGAKNRSNYDSRFLEFWKVYPKKVGKGAAERSFKKYKPDDVLLAVMLKAIETQKKSRQWQRDSGQYIPNPATWLNQKRWEDETTDNPMKGKELPYL